MITITQANTINNDARNHFRYGKKSDNKVYSFSYGNATEFKKTHRYEQAIKANESLRIQRTRGFDFYDQLDTRPEERAGNCGEYTEFAVNIALNMDQISTVWIFGCDKLGGVDHEFCVFNLSQAPNPNRITCLNGLSNETFRDDVIACDPWANIVCLYTDYPQRLREKMLKWDMRGKCIMIGSNPIPATEWGRKCLNAPIKFVQKR
ncbi:hypothetical protein AB204_03020 [Xenorhabdus khoisanae]|uniref:Uncharacterized protein n=1 Tax=Xenorhabdus khoisanae TaxID=880157 RepID=A0A0J5FWJ7_9GAMM|nr:hypothetical protein [Xenorhabdus khoisanae]KMJ46568.1 hypothetical protein AB204_03020 [Xenorhabdus khoisanae]